MVEQHLTEVNSSSSLRNFSKYYHSEGNALLRSKLWPSQSSSPSDEREQGSYVRSNIWPKVNSSFSLRNLLSTSQWSIHTFEEQTLTKSKFVPKRWERSREHLHYGAWIGLRIFSKSHTYNTMEATSLGEQTLTKSKFAPPSHSFSGAPCSNLKMF